jgi:histidine ammonia-lyase
MKIYKIGDVPLSISSISDILREETNIVLSASAKKKVKLNKEFLDKKIQKSTKPIYGINTGFGSLCNHVIDNNQLSQLQFNLVVSHACGTGDEVPKELVRIMLLLKVQSLSLGHSGVQLETINRLVEMFNNNILPVVYQQGSLGASGDLAPLAHLSLPLLALGEVDVLDTDGSFKRYNSKKVLKKMSWDPISLQAKEGLALLNGTQFMSAYGVWCLIKSQKLSYCSDLIASVSIDAFDARSESFDPLIHLVRPQLHLVIF